ncbi:LrgB family protein [Bergeyella sp. RCAD1439]|uniref:LrgB family protein n=1 Tax=Bergeyella anatis TaxID=3113737 RepID=UPI002E18AF65|nr:LrgB family protein [Bergeyella sp. RCAD1439]
MAFVSNPLVLFAVTLLFYWASGRLHARFCSVLLSPVLVTMGLLIGYLLVFDIPYETYGEVGRYIDFWLKPSVVALGVPLYLQLERVRKQLLPIVLAHFFGSVVGIFSVCMTAKSLGSEAVLIRSLAPKSATTPIAIEVSESLDGVVALTVAAVIFTGIVGSVIGGWVFRLFRIDSPMGQGMALGAASHGLGIVVARSMGEKHAAFAGVGLIFSGIFTAVLAPVMVPFLC